MIDGHAWTAGSMIEALVIGVTGHRNLAPDEVAGIRERVRGLFVDLRAAFPGLPLTLVSALAAGGDQLAAEEALALDMQLVAPLPLPHALYAGTSSMRKAGRASSACACALR